MLADCRTSEWFIDFAVAVCRNQTCRQIEGEGLTSGTNLTVADEWNEPYSQTSLADLDQYLMLQKQQKDIKNNNNWMWLLDKFLSSEVTTLYSCYAYTQVTNFTWGEAIVTVPDSAKAFIMTFVIFCFSKI